MVAEHEQNGVGQVDLPQVGDALARLLAAQDLQPRSAGGVPNALPAHSSEDAELAAYAGVSLITAANLAVCA